ncbi:MAG: GH25 family lysozyme [Pseudomonadota bacterium]
MLKSKTLICAIALLAAASANAADITEFNEPWKSSERALIIDGYEYNEFDLAKIGSDKRIAAFIHKGSDGLPAKYRCTGDAAEVTLCKTKWRRYAVGKELYQTRRAFAKSMGLKWGAYHLARPGNPVEQAEHFIEYTNPTDDEAIVLDIEDIDAEKWMSLADAEIFARHIRMRLGRWPMLYTNGNTAKFIAKNRMQYQILSRLPLWYARYKPDINNYFPKGNWDSYDIWQFQSQINCNKRRCPYRVKGANVDIDVNVVDMTVEELRAIWPMDELLEMKPPERLPIPMARPMFDEPTTMVAAIDPTGLPHQPTGWYRASASQTDIYAAYVEAAISRGAKIVEREVDTITTSSYVQTPINDLF